MQHCWKSHVGAHTSKVILFYCQDNQILAWTFNFENTFESEFLGSMVEFHPVVKEMSLEAIADRYMTVTGNVHSTISDDIILR